MFKGVNKATIVGVLGQDPEFRELKKTKVATLNLVTNELWTDSEGKKVTKASWHRIVIYGRLAEVARDYLKKGAEVYVEGSINYREWKTDSGEIKKSTEIVVSNTGTMQMLGGKRENTEGNNTKPLNNSQNQTANIPQENSNNPPLESYQNEQGWENDIPF